MNKISDDVPNAIGKQVVLTVPNRGTTFHYDPASKPYTFNFANEGLEPWNVRDCRSTR